MDILYLVLFFGIIHFTCVFAVYPNLFMFFNDLPIENGGIYEYQSGTQLTVTCQADGDVQDSGNSMDILNIVRTYNLPQNHENTPANNKKRDESFYDGSVKEISHTFELTPGENGVRITCGRKNYDVGVSTILIMKVKNPTKQALTQDLESTSFGKGIAVGVAITIFFGFLCWLIMSFFQTRQRPRLATPPPESDYASVYAWRKPLDPSGPPLPSNPPPDVLKTFQNFRFPLKRASSQTPNITNALSNFRYPLEQSSPSLSATQAPPNLRYPLEQSLPSLGATQAPPNLRYPLEQSLPSPGIIQTHSNLRFPQQSLLPPPDVTQPVKNDHFSKPPQSLESEVKLNIQNLQFLPKKPSLTGPSDIPRSRQFSVSAMQMAKLQAVMGTK